MDLLKTKHHLLTNFHFKLFYNTNFSSCFVCHVESITGSTLHLIHTGCISAFTVLQRFVFLLCSHLLPFKLFFFEWSFLVNESVWVCVEEIEILLVDWFSWFWLFWTGIQEMHVFLACRVQYFICLYGFSQKMLFFFSFKQMYQLLYGNN